MKKQESNVRLPGGYSVRGLLGHGALGASYLAFKRGAEEKRVFKILHHPEWLAEVPVLRVPGVWIGGKSSPGETAWIWSKHVSGGSLRAAMDRGTLPARQFGAILAGALEVLERVHAQAAIHGCLKPEDILLPEREGVAITDFGHLPLLRSKDRAAGDAYLFGRIVSREIRAPFTYLPAEVMGGDVVEPRCDVYAIGAILREGLEGRGARPPIPGALSEVIRTLTAPPSTDYPTARQARALIDRVSDRDWEGVPLIGESPPDREEETIERTFSFVEIPERPVPVAVGLPAEMSVFDISGAVTGPAAHSEDTSGSGGGGEGADAPEPLDPAEALRFLESMKKKNAPEEEEEPKEKKKAAEEPEAKPGGAFGLVVMGAPTGSKRETLADLIGPLLKISKAEALEKAREPVISILRGVSKLEAEKVYKRFKQAKVSARITTRLKKQKGR